MKKKEQTYLDPQWIVKTAALAMKRGTAIVFSKNRHVYGVLPKSSGGVNVYYEADNAWLDAVLSIFPDGAIFPNDNFFGGPATAKALRPYANIELATDGGSKAWIDPVTFALHIKGRGVTIKTAGFSEHGGDVTPCIADKIPELSFASISKEEAKLLVEHTCVNENRPGLKRVYAQLFENEMHLCSTDAKAAIGVRCENAPSGFSYDPKIVALHDIVGYAAVSGDATVLTTRYYKLKDGTVVVERREDSEIPNTAVVMDKVMNMPHTKCFENGILKTVIEQAAKLGLGADASFGGVVRITDSNVEFLDGKDVVASFDVGGSIKGAVSHFSLPVLIRILKVGGDFCVVNGGGPCISRNGGISALAMPVRLPGAGPTNAESPES